MIEFFQKTVEMDEGELIQKVGVGVAGSRPSKRVLQQTQRLLELAEDMQQIRPERDALSLLWCSVCAESVSRIESGDQSSEGAGKHARRFFLQLLPPSEREELAKSFVDGAGHAVGLKAGVGALYRVRCLLAHDGEYWSFKFSTDGKPRQLIPAEAVHTSLSRGRFHRLVALGGLETARKLAASGR
jgi:hypothetical protein